MTLLWILLLSFAFAIKTLKFAGIFCRHGARSPLVSLPIFDSLVNWPYGYGELTPSGQRQLYLLGRVLRDKYIGKDGGLLPPVYNESTIHVRTTSYHRTVMSINSLLQGLYPGGAPELSKNQMENKAAWMPPIGFNGLPIVIDSLGNNSNPHSLPPMAIKNYGPDHDKLLKMSSCPLYVRSRMEYFKSSKCEELNKKLRVELELACGILKVNCSGLKGESPMLHADYLLAAEYDGQLSSLTPVVVTMEKLLEFYSEMLLNEVTFSNEMPKIVMKSFHTEMKSMFTQVIENKNPPKMALYGTHDDIIVAYLHALGVDKKHYKKIPYASYIEVQLFSDNANPTKTEYTVRLDYNGVNMIDESLDAFYDRITKQADIGTSWEDACQLDSNFMPGFEGESRSTLWLTVLIIGAVMAILGVAVLVKVMVMKRNATEAHEDPLQ